MRILGIHAGHDAGVAVAEDGKIIFAMEEERVTGIKKIYGFPARSLLYCLQYLGCNNRDFDKVIFGQKNNSFNRSSALVASEQCYFYSDATFIDHHYAHAVSAYAWSGWDECLVMTLDGGGDNNFGSIYEAKGGVLTLVDTLSHIDYYPFGLLYNNATEIAGFTPNRHEGKIMGLAAHGTDLGMFEGLFWVDGTQIKSDTKGGTLGVEKYVVHERIGEWQKEHGDLEISDLSASCQATFEKIILEWVRINAKGRKLAVAGGCFANVIANMKIAKEVEALWVCPAMFDNGLAIGAALSGFDKITTYRPADIYFGIPQDPTPENTYSPKEVAEMVDQGKIVGLFQGAMEYGPRALGNRTILADARNPEINAELNKRLGRSEFMPFAPVILEEFATDILEDYESGIDNAPFMTCCWSVKEEWREKIPGVVHIDGTARPQVIKRDVNPFYYDIVSEFHKQTGVPVMVNTSFNAHEEPILCFLEEAVWALLSQRVDVLVEGPK